ncbi:MAG: hypothetical protein OHK006_06270 [Thermodesulfovibrionales bacterium]
MISRSRIFASPVLLIAASVSAFFIALEVMLALFWPHKVIIQSYHEKYHPVIGWVNKQDVSGYFYLKRNIRFFRTHNGNGVRSLRETPYAKPAGVKRVLLLGDSFFWGYGVNDQDILSEVLQRMAGRGIDVINGAASGYGTDQELLWLVEEGMKYAPDLVVLGAFPLNDWDEISHSVNYGYPKPFFSLEEEKLVLHNVPVPDTRETRRKAFEEPETVLGKAKKFLRHHTHTYPFLAKRLNSIPVVRDFLLRAGLADEFTSALPGIRQMTLDQKKIRPLFESLVMEMKNVSAEAGAGFLLVFIPEKETTPGAPLRYPGVTEEAAERNTAFSRYLAGFAAEKRIPLLDLLPIIRERHGRGETLYTAGSYDHHWTPAGHRAAAEALLAWLTANGYATSSLPHGLP